MGKEQYHDFLSEFVVGNYPEAFVDRYELLECLACNTCCETLLVKDKAADTLFVAKCYKDRSRLSSDDESELLGRLHHPGLPALSGKYQNSDMLCVVREYAQGAPLNEWRDVRKPSVSEVIGIGAQLCDILSYLHSQTPPVIHRDLKPQNIIVSDQGCVKLIDFGISRTFEQGAKADTVCFGTVEFAPPEQYGFSQTDSRADTYSLGVVLRYLLTGETDAGKAAGKIQNKKLQSIIQKCTEFSPKQRYASAALVKRALLAVNSRARKVVAVSLAAALAALSILSAGFAVGRYTEFLNGVLNPSRAIVFKEPLIERAVRQTLGKSGQDVLTSKDLAGVTQLYIRGGVIAENLDGYYAVTDPWETIPGGKATNGINTLADIKMLPNLSVLMVCDQRIMDLSPVAGMTGLTYLDIDKNPVRDISAVRGLKELEFIGLNETKVTDLSPLATCPNLNKIVLDSIPADDFSVLASMPNIEFLHIVNIKPEKVLPYLKGKHVRQLRMGYVQLPAFADLNGIEGLQELYLDTVWADSLSGIEALTGLTEVRLTGMQPLDLSPLLSLPRLQQLVTDEKMREKATVIADKAHFKIVYN